MRVGECLALFGLAVGSAWRTFLVLNFQPMPGRKANKFEWSLAATQCNIGGCYRDGFGVAKDMVEAARWFRKAAEQGHQAAKEKLAEFK